MSRLADPVYRRRVLELVADALLCAAAFALAFKLRFLDVPGGIPERYETMLAGSVAFVAVGKTLVLELLGQHRQWWRYFRLPDLWPLVRTLALASALMVLAFALLQPYDDSLPRSVVIFDLLLSAVFLAGARLARRSLAERPSRAARKRGSRDVLVIGAGSGGQMVVRELKLNPNLGARAIGFVDDDPRKRGMRTEGLKVLGSTGEIGAILDRTAPDEVVIAIPSAPGVLRAKVVAACRERDIPVQTLPTVFELLRGGVQLTRQLREVRVEDVLGRDPVVMELDRVGAYLEDRIVLVTGAGGSIGAELSRQIARVRPRLLVLLDHAEDNLFAIDREMTDQWHFTRVESVLADCKEGDRMLEVMERFRPDVVFHAAAYKHVPLMEANPLEALRNNAIATQVTAKTAAAAGAGRFVLVSTDKAVNPRTVMGATKAMAEWVVEAAGQRHPATRFVNVRFGNVLASSGSVVPIFRSQIEHGGPLTVTHPEMSRYFMTIPEAVQLVIQAADLGGSSGEVFVLEMGEPVRIVELARNMIRLAGYEPEIDIAIEFIGPRPGEKLHEELFNTGERAQPTTADRIVRAVREQPLDPGWVETTIARLEAMVASGDEAGLADEVKAAASSASRPGAAGSGAVETAGPSA
ncbi:MAG: polysaccharide biosynthesis protein [Solirubrobacterales bacterium]